MSIIKTSIFVSLTRFSIEPRTVG